MIEQLQDLMRQVAQDEVMARFGLPERGVKKDGSFCTPADVASQERFERALPSIRPAPVLGEEMPTDKQRQLWRERSVEGLWVVDPIDGTTNYANGVPHFALSVAYVEGGRSIAGAILNPVTGEMFWAIRGEGAYLGDIRLPLRKPWGGMRDSIAAVDAKYLRSGKLASRLQNLSPCGSRRSFGSTVLDWCYLAAGRFSLGLHGGQKLWDYAAGSLVFEESGGLIDTLEGDAFWSGLHVFSRSSIASATPELRAAWLKWVRDNQ